jgi:pimeloyl-ACP methyl ester carboxylesterase
VALADALKVSTFSLLGVSYGSKLAQTVVRAYPKRIRAVILDAATPVEAHLLEVPAHNARRALEALFAACAADEVCTEQHGDLAAAFERTTTRLRAAPVEISIHGKPAQYGASQFVQSVLRMLADITLLPGAPAFIHQIERAEYEGAELLLNSPSRSTTTWLMNSAVMCAEELPWNDGALATADLASFPDYSPVSNYDALAERCVAISVTAEPASTKTPLETAVPVLAMTGRFDPLSPNLWWQRFAERFAYGVLLDFPDSGHAVWHHSCAQTVMAAFLDAPSTWTVPACYAALKGPAFMSSSREPMQAGAAKASSRP